MLKPRIIPGLALAASAWIALAGATAAAAPTAGPPDAPVVTQHQVALDGRATPYTAEAGRIAIRDVETGEPHGWMFYVAFRVPSPGKPRPVTFVWNGGPGANSTLLDFGVAGPKRLIDGRLHDNPQSWLAATDLVFVDPIGAGFSRPAKAEYENEFYGTLGDVASVTEFVRAWRLLHAAEDAPLFLAGESWGAGRAASVGYALQKRGIEVGGLVLISGGAGLNTMRAPQALAEALRVVDLAATARHHGRLGRPAGEAADATRRAAQAWARQVYAPALEDPAKLSDAQREAIVATLAGFTGLPPDQIDRRTLRITPRQFRTGLLKAQGRTLDVFDMRRIDNDDERAGGGAILAFLRRDLGYRTDLPYVGLEPWEAGWAPAGKYPQSINARWNYATAQVTPEQMAAAIAEASRTGAGPPRLGPPLPAVEELLALNPRTRVLVAAGQYDSLNSCAANEELANRLTGPARAAIQFRCYGGGHMMYRDEAARVQLSRDVAALIASAGGRP